MCIDYKLEGKYFGHTCLNEMLLKLMSFTKH